MAIISVIIELPCVLLILVIKLIANATGNTREKIHTKGRPATGPAKERTAKLSEDQREKIVTAIIEDSLLINDRAFDALMQTGECLYNAAEASKTENSQFELQYGSKDWIRAWTAALGRWFDCDAEYASNGTFHVYGKEA